jgi:glycosyltransferase involved in cell wall biosynthesis
MRIALVHEFLNQLGGAEKVLHNFLQIWPDATVHVILYNKEKTNGEFEKYQKKISLLNKFPLSQSHPRLLLPLMPQAIEDFKFSDYDVVLSDSSSFAKGAKSKGKLHICYCHTPTRFLWTEPEYLDYQRYPGLFKRVGKMFIPVLKKWDYKAAQRPDFYIANSENVRTRIQKFYNRDSVVIPPPVDTEMFYPKGDKKNYFFTASRLEPYKKVDVIIEAFNELGLPLKIAGTGTIEDKLKVMAKSNIEFLGRITDEQMREHYAESKAFVFAAEEDAGIVFLEAQACGTPVIAYGKGGALEVVKEGVTGEFFHEQTTQSLVEVLKQFEPTKYDSKKIHYHAQAYDKKNFQRMIKEFVENKYAHRT